MRKTGKKKFLLRNRKKKKFIFLSLLFLLGFIGLGYAVFETNLMISGDLLLKKYNCTVGNSLYKVLQCEYMNGGDAREYSGAHHDSFTEEPSKKIYYWYAETNSHNYSNKTYVYFANHCWRLFRTTDTGGVKLLYNGVANGQTCSNLSHEGYYDNISLNLNSNYWYGTDYNYNSDNSVFTLSGTTEQATWGYDTASNLIGKYTCKKTNLDATCSSLYYIESYNDSENANVLELRRSANPSGFGFLKYNTKDKSLAYVGYMYNKAYETQSINYSKEQMLRSTSPSGSIYYSNSISWNSTTNNYNLINPTRISKPYSNLVGNYSFLSSNSSYTSPRIDYIATVDGSTIYYIQLSDGEEINDVNHSYSFGDSFIDNGDGSFSIENPTTISRSDWYSYYSAMKDKYVCKNAVNNICNSLWFVTDTSLESFSYVDVSKKKFGNSFHYSNGKYILDDTVDIYNYTSSDSVNDINFHHYTCWNDSGECSTLSYLFYLYSNGTIYYINLEDGLGIEDAINEMLFNDDVNSVNSPIKTGVDAWYEKYMLDYSDYLDDIVFCNDRSIKYLNGWNPDGGSIRHNSDLLTFRFSHDSLDCPNVTDQFSISNDKARLKYKVALGSTPEFSLFGWSYFWNDGNYWLMTPAEYPNFSPALEVGAFSDAGTAFGARLASTNGGKPNYGLKPVIALKPGIGFTSGDGSRNNPYVIDTN